MAHAHLVDLDAAETLDVLGPTLTMLTPAGARDDVPCHARHHSARYGDPVA